MDINIKVIPHDSQRYQTCGDWWWTSSPSLEIRVSKLDNEYQEFCVAIHELCEAILCRRRSIPQKVVDEFDTSFEIKREHGLIEQSADPGDDSLSPYRREHCFATGVERLLVSELGLDWSTYEKVINSL